MAEPVAIASRLRRVIGNAVALDAAHESAGRVSVHNTEIDAISRHPDLRNDLQPSLHERRHHLALERRFGGPDTPPRGNR